MDISSISAYNTSLMQLNIDKTEQAQAQSFENALNKAVENQNAQELKEACKEFESYFVSYIFKQMQNSVNSINNGKGVINRSQGEEIFTEMLLEEYSETAAEHGGIGLADMMYKQLSKNL